MFSLFIGEIILKKLCIRCKEIRDIECFGIDKKRKDNRNVYCKICLSTERCLPHNRKCQQKRNEKHRALPGYKERKFINNRRYCQSDRAERTRRIYYEKNREKLERYHRAYIKVWAKTSIGKASLKRAREKCYYKDIEKSRKICREFYYRRKQDVQYRIHDAISSSIYDAIKKNKNGRSWEKLVGFTLSDLMIHLQKLFQPEMSWKNYGKWHIDHVIPRSRFHFQTAEDPEFKRCWALSNLQPLWAADNIRKYNH